MTIAKSASNGILVLPKPDLAEIIELPKP